MMAKKIMRVLLATGAMLFLLLNSGGCAKRGMPTGGPKDSIPPAFVNAQPYNFSTNFSAKKIKIQFDEYIKLEKPQRQVIISPPMDPKPEIRPLGTASKEITVIIGDTLAENTTYTINFGKSITDNTEGNPLPFFKYVFSTGDDLDSLSISGRVDDALQSKMKKNATVMLYRMDSVYTDSTIYEKPGTYLAYTKDTVNTFKMENMKAGKYQIVALIDKNNNYQYDPKSDKIGYLKDPIELPNDSLFNLQVFKGILDFEVKRPNQVTKKHFIFGFEGELSQPKIELLNAPEDFRSSYYRDRKTDTLHYYYEPFIKADSLLFEITQKNYRDTLEIVPRDVEKDSLTLKAKPSGAISFHQEFKILSNTPIKNLDTTKFEIRDKDSVLVDYSVKLDSLYNEVHFKFEKDEKQRYFIQALPGAITDFYNTKNDTLNYSLSTPEYASKSNLTLSLQKLKRFPVLLQLVDEEGEIKFEKTHTKEEGNKFEFRYIDPGTYFVRLIYDDNANGKWDPGTFLDKTQPEEVRHYRKALDLRKNWDVVQKL
jgi:uncharacterized protein (DUF2141 family)